MENTSVSKIPYQFVVTRLLPIVLLNVAMLKVHLICKSPRRKKPPQLHIIYCLMGI